MTKYSSDQGLDHPPWFRHLGTYPKNPPVFWVDPRKKTRQ